MNEAIAAFEKACAHDRVGEEAEAIPHYERALALGLPPNLRPNACVGLGSSLRNVGRTADAITLLRAATAEFPDHAAPQAFLALALYSDGNAGEAVKQLLAIAIRHAPVGQYARALTEYRDQL